MKGDGCRKYAQEAIIEMMIFRCIHDFIIDWQVRDLFVKLFTYMVILNMSLVGVHVRTHLNIRLAHVLVDDYVSQVIDMEMSN